MDKKKNAKASPVDDEDESDMDKRGREEKIHDESSVSCLTVSWVNWAQETTRERERERARERVYNRDQILVKNK